MHHGGKAALGAPSSVYAGLRLTERREQPHMIPRPDRMGNLCCRGPAFASMQLDVLLVVAMLHQIGQLNLNY
jgi:hypothetical protein